MTQPADDCVGDDETLLRRIPDLGRADFFPVDHATGERRLSSGAFTPDDDGISVYRDSLLSRAGLDTRAVVRDPLNAVAALPVATVRTIDLDVVPDPQPPASGDRDPRLGAAHALITGFASLSRGQRRRRQRDLAAAARVVVWPEGLDE